MQSRQKCQLDDLVDRSVFEGQEAGHTSFDPLGLWAGGGQLEIEHEVGRVTRGRQRTVTREHLINGTLIYASLGLLAVLYWHEVDHRHLNEELLWLTILQLLLIVIPSATLEIETVDVATRLGLGFDILVRHLAHHNMVKTDLIDSDRVLSGVVLLSSSKEGLWEEESGDPEDIWSSVVEPVDQEIDSIIAVLDPGSEWLLTKEALSFTIVGPHGWDLVIEDGC